jgi:hypothetical protein
MAKKKAMAEGRMLAIRHFRQEGWTVHELASYKADMMDPAEYWLEKAITRAINKAAWDGFSEGVWVGEYTVNSYNGRTAIKAVEVKYGPRPTPKPRAK